MNAAVIFGLALIGISLVGSLLVFLHDALLGGPQ
jgi:hypothetical protein